MSLSLPETRVPLISMCTGCAQLQAVIRHNLTLQKNDL